MARNGPQREARDHDRRAALRVGPGRPSGPGRVEGAGLRAARGHPAALLRNDPALYDPSIAAWRSTWIDPLNGRVRRFIGRPDGADIVLDGIDDEPPERWCFRDITADSFRWTGEVSGDDRRTWHLDEQMFIRRRA